MVNLVMSSLQGKQVGKKALKIGLYATDKGEEQ